MNGLDVLSSVFWKSWQLVPSKCSEATWGDRTSGLLTVRACVQCGMIGDQGGGQAAGGKRRHGRPNSLLQWILSSIYSHRLPICCPCHLPKILTSQLYWRCVRGGCYHSLKLKTSQINSSCPSWVMWMGLLMGTMTWHVVHDSLYGSLLIRLYSSRIKTLSYSCFNCVYYHIWSVGDIWEILHKWISKKGEIKK